MPYFNYKGKSVYYNELGNGEPLLLLHGNTASSKMFDKVSELLSTKATIGNPLITIFEEKEKEYYKLKMEQI